MRRALLFAPAVALAALPSCSHDASVLPPYGQVLLYVDTDAPLPPAPGEPTRPDDPTPLFDRVRIEVYRPGEATPCAECTHEFDVDRSLVARGAASVGITPVVGATGYVARVRLFRAAFVEGGEPRPDTTLETTVALPAIRAEGIVPVTVALHTDDVAKPIGSREQPVAPQDGAPTPGFAGSWSGARRVPCSGDRGDAHRVCIPGGAYWSGNPRLRLLFSGGEHTVMRIVVVSPFWLDTHEVTVAEFRASGLATAKDPLPFNGDDGKPGQFSPCTYQPVIPANDALPVTCVSWEAARAYCQNMDADLPSEAQFDYAAGGLAGHTYVWGEDPPTCNDVVVARNRNILPPFLLCPGGWLEQAGRGERDRLVRPDGVVVDLMGNASEHVLDLANEMGEPCWQPGVDVDPVCDTPTRSYHGKTPLHGLTGASWNNPLAVVSSIARGWDAPFAEQTANASAIEQHAVPLSATGFRCAKSAKP